MTTALISHPDCLGHVNPAGAPEQVARLDYVMRALQGLDLLALEAPLASTEQIARVHDEAYVASIPGEIPPEGHNWLDGDTYLAPGSMNAILRAAGGAVRAVDAVVTGEAQNAFVATRPPGHHAEQARAMGFCVFGNVAIAAAHALDHHGLERVAVLDFDVHHGNGTQALLQEDPRVFFVSSHQSPLWPGSGMVDDRGPHDTLRNLPLAPNTGGETMWRFWQPVLQEVREFKPQMILISAGFDAHQDDPLANLRWRVEDFRRLTGAICDLAADACDGRVVSVLEGGYDLDALAASAKAHVGELIKAGT